MNNIIVKYKLENEDGSEIEKLVDLDELESGRFYNKNVLYNRKVVSREVVLEDEIEDKTTED